MNTRVRTRFTILYGSIPIALAGAIAQAQPASPITFLEGGYAELCSSTAHDIGDPAGIMIVGSRVPLSPLELCTMAIRESNSKGVSPAASYTNRGVLHFANGTLDAALADFDEAVRLDDTMVQAHINRAYIFNLRQQWAESIAAADHSITLGIDDPRQGLAPKQEKLLPPGAVPEIARVYYVRGIAHEELGHTREAYLDYLKASELAPEWPEPKQELTRFAFRPR